MTATKCSAEEIPVVLFVYKRTAELSRLLRCLEQQRVMRIIVFADGPKTSSEANRVESVRALVRAVRWADVELYESETNLGLGPSILRGVSTVAKNHSSFIVLEDDFEIAPGTMSWIRAALLHYADEPRVFSVTGWTHPAVTPRSAKDSAYFDARAECWVWGSWSRAWAGMNQSAIEKVQQCRQHGVDPASIGSDVPDMAEREERDRIWAVRWLCHHLQHDALCLRPPWSLVDHIGTGPLATNAGGAFEWRNKLDRAAPSKPFCWPDIREAIECRELWRAVIDRNMYPSWWARAIRKLRRSAGLNISSQ